MVLLVDFTLAGHKLQGLNGGPDLKFNEAISLVIECEDQAEVDRLWGPAEPPVARSCAKSPSSTPILVASCAQ